jgi:FKBP-type peptidyl-prolyl cis-trans isomerase FkpA
MLQIKLFFLQPWSFLIGVVLLFSSCNSEYPGYKKHKNGVYYNLLSIGESDKNAVPGDYVTVDLVYKTLSDSAFFTARRKFKLTDPQFEGSIDHCFLMMCEKDKASFIISADGFFNQTLNAQLPSFLEQGDKMIVEIAMVDIQTENEYIKEKEAFLAWIDDFGEYEGLLLKQYIEETKMDMTPLESGIYKVNLEPGNGNIVSIGDTVVVHFEGKFLNGKFFDSTKKRKEPFKFILGQKWQVIEGVEKAIGMMEEGERSVFIFPSELAFGESGSSTGIIPPFTSLVFEIELLSIGKK